MISKRSISVQDYALYARYIQHRNCEHLLDGSRGFENNANNTLRFHCCKCLHTQQM